MYRLLSLPHQAHVAGITPLSGPNARNSGRNTVADGTEQTFDTVGDLVSFRLDFAPSVLGAARYHRGMMMALASGANAIRVRLIDPDKRRLPVGAVPWSNGSFWSNGQPWSAALPLVEVAGSAPAGSSLVRLDKNKNWGGDLEVGEYVGFVDHFGWYMVTEADPIAVGTYRIWPRLRRSVTVGQLATLSPTIAVKTFPGGTSGGRGQMTTEGNSVSLVEVPDPQLRAYYSDTGT